MRQLAKPTPSIFAAIKKSVFEQLTAYFAQYALTPDYKHLGMSITEQVASSEQLQRQAMKGSASTSILGFLIPTRRTRGVAAAN